MSNQATLSAQDRQFNRNKWLFSVSGIGRDMSYQLIASFLLTYIQFGMTLSIVQFTTISLLIGAGGRIWDFDQTDGSCKMLISSAQTTDGNGNVIVPKFNAANDNFKQESNLSMRIWVRVGVSVVPVVCLLVALFIQNKKFIIDEEYYDMMMAEIENRNTSDGDAAPAATECVENGEVDVDTDVAP